MLASVKPVLEQAGIPLPAGLDDGKVDAQLQEAQGEATKAYDTIPESVILSVRPEQMQLVRPYHPRMIGTRVNRLVAKSHDWTFLGEASEHGLLVNGHKLKVVSTPPMFEVPEQVEVEFDPHDVVVLAQ